MEYSALPAIPARQPDPGRSDIPSGERIAQLQPIAALARILQQLESDNSLASPAYAQQYKSVAAQLAAIMQRVEPDALLYQVLSAFPAAAELYENVRFEYAGLCLHDLEQSAKAERATRAVLSKLFG